MSRQLNIGGKRLVIGGKILAFPDGAAAPVASFTFTPSYPAEGDLWNGTNTSTGGPFTAFSWKKDGVEFSTDENPTGIDLGAADTYTIELTVTNASGSDSDSQDVTVFPVGAVDSDAADFATRHGSLTDSQFAAVNAAVLQVKDAGLWTNIKAWWPIIGGTAALHALNLRTTSFDITFTDPNGRFTHDANGILRNSEGFGVSTSTGITPSTHLTSINAVTLLAYSRTNNTGSDRAVLRSISGTSTQLLQLGIALFNGNPSFTAGGTTDIESTGARTGTIIGTRTSSSSLKIYRRDASSTTTVATNTATVTGALPDTEMTFLANGSSAGANQICAAMVIDAGVTDSEAATLAGIVENMQAALGRSAFTNNADEQNFIDGIDNALDGTDDVQIYSGGSRNASLWLTPVPTWAPVGGNNGVPITPRHMLFAAHYAPGNGSTITFKTAAGATVTRTITGSPQAVTGSQDMVVCKLDSDLPGTITVPKIGPANLDALCRVSLLPMVSTFRGTTAHVGMCSWTNSSKNQLNYSISSDADRAAVWDYAVDNVSGSWCGLITADTSEPVTLGCMHLGPGDGGARGQMGTTDYAGAYATELQAAVTALGAEGHSVTAWAP